MQGKIIDFVQKSEKVVVFLSVYRQVLPRDDRVIFALTGNKLRTTHFSANNTQFPLPPPIVLQVCRLPGTRQTTLPHVIFCSTSYMPQPPLFWRPISHKIKQKMQISKLFEASCTHSIAIYKVLCYNNQALGA